MDTVSKGDQFETMVFDAISEELKNDRLGLSPATARPFRKKGYFSPDRRDDIIVDISLEVWPPNANSYSLLWVCECKDYGRRIPVDDIEEFKAKLDQIAGKNVKGVFATTNSLQQGALSYAQANGIGVVRILPDGQVKWVLYYATPETICTRNSDSHWTALTRENYVGEGQAFYGAYGGYCMDSWGQILKASLKGQQDQPKRE